MLSRRHLISGTLATGVGLAKCSILEAQSQRRFIVDWWTSIIFLSQ